MNTNQLLSIEEVAMHCETMAKYVALWHNSDAHQLPKICVCLSFAEHLRHYRLAGADDTWDCLVDGDCADDPALFANMNKNDLHMCSSYLSMLHEEVLCNQYTSWLDEITPEIERRAADILQMSGRNK